MQHMMGRLQVILLILFGCMFFDISYKKSHFCNVHSQQTLKHWPKIQTYLLCEGNLILISFCITFQNSAEHPLFPEPKKVCQILWLLHLSFRQSSNVVRWFCCHMVYYKRQENRDITVKSNDQCCCPDYASNNICRSSLYHNLKNKQKFPTCKKQPEIFLEDFFFFF